MIPMLPLEAYFSIVEKCFLASSLSDQGCSFHIVNCCKESEKTEHHQGSGCCSGQCNTWYNMFIPFSELLQGEMQQLRDKLAVAERAAKAEAQLKVS